MPRSVASKPVTSRKGKSRRRAAKANPAQSTSPESQLENGVALLPEDLQGRIHLGDCIAGMNALPAGSIDLVFADPPFNIGYDYDVYHDAKHCDEYLEWSRQWIAAVHRALKPDGTFWLAIGDEYAAELKLASQRLGFHTRSWVIWYYTFGVNCKYKFSRSHAHLFHFVKDPERFTFLHEELENRIPSARLLVYGDRRGNPIGRLPDDTWIIRPAGTGEGLSAEEAVLAELPVADDADDPQRGEAPNHKSQITNKSQLPTPNAQTGKQNPHPADDTWVLRPQDLAGDFSPQEDTWYFPRVAGTFKERSGFHGCQMPEQLLGRIVRICSRPRDIVLDPFSGSATTLAVAKKLGRRFLGFDLSPQYVERGTARLADTFVGDPLDGAPEPTMSAPATVKTRGESRAAGKSPLEEILDASADARDARCREAFLDALIEAFRRVYQGYSLDRVVVDPELSVALADECGRLGLPGDLGWWNRGLFRARKAGRLAHLPTTRRTELSWEHCDQFLFAAEIAWRQLLDQGYKSLDEILCDPRAAQEFDRLASRFASGFTSLDYRWAALKLRKQRKVSRSRAALIQKFDLHFGEPVEPTPSALSAVTKDSGLFLVEGENPGAQDWGLGVGDRKRGSQSATPSRRFPGLNAENSVPGTQYSVPALYLGTALNLHARLEQTMTRISGKAWTDWSESPTIRHVAIPGNVPLLLAYQSLATARHTPLLNLPALATA